jgi:hypothetical protein
MILQSKTRDYQHLLGDYCKTGKEQVIPGITEGRVHHYRRLVYNVVKNTMDQAYPITAGSLDTELWEGMVNDFFANHSAQTPQLWKLPLEFYEYHYSVNTAVKLEKPYLNDLLYFEWAEIEIHTMPDKEVPLFISEGDPLKDILVINPEHEILQLDYPVHKESLDGIENKKGQYFVLLFREPENGNVRFMDLSMLHAFIIMKISETSVPLDDFKGEIASIASIESEKFLDDFLSTFILDLLKRKMIRGYKK